MENEFRVTIDLKNTALAMNRAAVAEDFDAARYWATRIAKQSARCGQLEIEAAALRVLLFLGPSGSEPTRGFGKAMFELAELLIRFGERVPHSNSRADSYPFN